jgi:hypothetical protein
MKLARRWIAATLLGIALAGAKAAEAAAFEWEPGRVFREHTFLPKGVRPDDGNSRAHISEIDPGTKKVDKLEQAKSARAPRLLALDPTGVTRAEMAIEYWSGHAGTTAWFRYNRNSWYPLPRPLRTPLEPERYYHTVLGNRVVPLEVKRLVKGDNTFAFTAGPQIIEGGFDWGFFWIYSFTARLYYPRAAEHPSVRIANVRTGDALREQPEITVEPRAGGAPIERVDVYAFYDDFNYSGSGLHREWHAQTEYGKPRFHAGSATAAPWRVTWDTTWVPDQSKPIRLIARVVDAAGWHATSEIVNDLSLRRGTRHVAMCPALDMPTLWGVRVGAEKSCHFDVPALAGRVSAVKLKVMSWSGNHADVISFNGTHLPVKIGRVHDYQVDMIEIPRELVKPGRNTFSVKSTLPDHPAEIDWPGPVLLLEYSTPD